MKHFGDLLAEACLAKKSAVCVGLDPRWSSLPDGIRNGVDDTDLAAVARATQTYCCEVIDAVAPFAPVVKPQAAFFELLGPQGGVALANVIQHARQHGMLVLLDGKRGDIGSTAEGYASAYLGESSPWGADALTVNPFLGDDTLAPFCKTAHENGAGIFVLVKTSNPGSGFVQDLEVDQQSVSERVAGFVESSAASQLGQHGFGSVGAVVGATYPEQLVRMRSMMEHAWILIPGYGAQGGSARDVAGGFQDKGAHEMSLGAVVNSSRGIIFAYRRPEYASLGWQEAVAKACEDMKLDLSAAIG
ncbi:MAG: orotidine-5'-phosphate decarboxylase [Pirellulaceae bacterium]